MVRRDLTKAQLQEFQEIFSLVDSDGGGSISKDELSQLLQTLNIKFSEEQLDMMMAEVDSDGSGYIEFQEFVDLMAKKGDHSYTPEVLLDAFKQFESEDCNDGWVRVDLLEKALTTYGDNTFSQERALELLSTLDPDNSGKFNYQQFIKVMTDGGNNSNTI
ncbi:calmodulin [Acrasis kona]|uniref:Calmodulin n=1 Tax=Acrasis kona TaxID=1008807 RepID=A0AAW2YRK0_9EUKA